MADYIGSEPGLIDKIGFIGVCLTLCLLFIAMMQPIWRGEEMIADLRANCSKVGGVMLEHKGMFGITYECAERKD